jgi:hypothetical protein
MLSYDELSRHPGAFPSLTGMTRAEFDELLGRFRQAEAQMRGKGTRRGGKPRRRAPGPGRKRLSSAAEVMAAFPQVRVIIDAKEQRVNKPQGEEKQRPYYPGKEEAHTVKTQVVVNPRGQIEGVSDSVPGSTHDLTLLAQSGVLEGLGQGQGAMMGKGYVGVDKHHPTVPVVLPVKEPRGGELSEGQRGYNRRVSRHRIVVEHTVAQLSRFTALRQVFRAKQRGSHGKVFRVVAKLVNRRLAVKPLKTYAA